MKRIPHFTTLLLLLLLSSLAMQAQEIRLKTQKKVGSKVSFTLVADGKFSISGVKEKAQSSNEPQEYTLEQQEILLQGNIKTLKVGNAELTELAIQECSSLEVLDCSQNLLQELDLTGAPQLKDLSCFANKLMRIDLSACLLLEQLKCTNNQLATLDVAHLTKLKELTCSKNALTKLDVSKMTQLETLKCYQNQLTALDLSSAITLEKLWCSENNLQSLDLSSNTKLKVVWCYANQITQINLGEMPDLLWLHCDNNRLTSLDCSRMPKLTKLSVYGNEIRGKAMTDLIQSMPTKRDNQSSFLVVDTQNSQEKNLCTTDQVDLANSKGWIVLDYCGGANDHQGISYAGDTAMDEVADTESQIQWQWTPAGMLLLSGIKEGNIMRAYDLEGHLLCEVSATANSPLLLPLGENSTSVLLITLDGKLLAKVIQR